MTAQLQDGTISATITEVTKNDSPFSPLESPERREARKEERKEEKDV
jgi:hypothetical protein